MYPEQYSRRILLCVAGLSPQIVTETLYALTVVGKPRFVPTEIHLLTTAEGAERARLTLLSDEPGWFHRLRQDYGLPEIRFDPNAIHILRAADGRPLVGILRCLYGKYKFKVHIYNGHSIVDPSARQGPTQQVFCWT